MKTKRTRRGVLAVVVFVALVSAGYLLPPLFRERVRSQRIQAVNNNIAPVLGVKQNTNPPPAVPTKK